MPYSLPQEILDLIIDHLHDDPQTLKTCCIVSKVWIHWTRRHLFNHLKFRFKGRDIGQWRETFPDPLNSPSHHTRTLSIYFPELVTTEDTNSLLTFCGVSTLIVVVSSMHRRNLSLAPLCGFSFTVRSLRMKFGEYQSFEVLDLIYSLPLLEDLSLVCNYGRQRFGVWNNTNFTSPRFTGTLELRFLRGMRLFACRLLDLPNGIHFKKIAVYWSSQDDVGLTMDLVAKCSRTLECLEIRNNMMGVFPSAIITN